jgi:hypothetical protein
MIVAAVYTVMTDPHFQTRPAQAVARIKASRVKDEQTEYLVSYVGDHDSKGEWVASARLDAPRAITDFQLRERKKQQNSAKVADPAPRQLKEICGVIPGGQTWSFVVRFVDGTRDEEVPKATMRANYPKQLLKFYESRIEQLAEEMTTP